MLGSLGEHSQHLAHLAHRRPTGRLDHPDRGPGGARITCVQGEPGRAGLDRHHAEPVSDDVMQVPGDPQPLLRGRPLPHRLDPTPIRAHQRRRQGHQHSQRHQQRRRAHPGLAHLGHPDQHARRRRREHRQPACGTPGQPGSNRWSRSSPTGRPVASARPPGSWWRSRRAPPQNRRSGAWCATTGERPARSRQRAQPARANSPQSGWPDPPVTGAKSARRHTPTARATSLRDSRTRLPPDADRNRTSPC